MSTDSNTRKPVPKKKMYGKNVKSHLSGWFGRDLWSQVESDVVPRKKKDIDKRQPTVRSEAYRKQLVEEEEERSSTDTDTSSRAQVPPAHGIPITKDIEEVEVSGSPVEFRDLEAEIDAVLESMERLDVQSLDGQATTGAPITVDITPEYEPPSESTNPHSPAKSFKESSDKENEEPPSPPPSSPVRQSRRNSRGRPPASFEALPREALRERSLSPDAGDVFESPARRNGLRKRGGRRSTISIQSPLLSSPHRKETKRSGEYQGDCSELGNPIMVWEDEGVEGLIRVGPLVNVLGRKVSRLEDIEIPDSEDEGDAEDVIQPITEPTTSQRGKPSLVQEKHKKGFAVVIDPRRVSQGVGPVNAEPVPARDTTPLEATVEQPPIGQLLRYCSESSILNFEDYIDRLLESCSIRKLGEASYSEVFLQSTPSSSSTTVLKVIPFGGFGQCRLESIIQEIRITKALGEIEGFVGFRGAYAVQGCFPQVLMDEWDYYDENRSSENNRPDFYEEDQMFAIICLENGGVDLEHFELNGWEEAWEVFWQVTLALARGEKERDFEHRDLHCGNIVIRRLSDEEDFPEDLLAKLSLQDGDPEQSPGQTQSRLKVALIDYTLSRANCGEDQSLDPGTEFAPLDDDALFGGKGNYQFDVYRFMRNHLSSGLVDPSEEWIDWNVYAPRTNVFWLHYLTNMLLTEKKIPRPAARGRNAATEAQKKCFRGLEAVAKTLDPRKKRFAKDHVELGSAGEVVEWAVEQGIWEGAARVVCDY